MQKNFLAFEEATAISEADAEVLAGKGTMLEGLYLPDKSTNKAIAVHRH